MNRNSWIAELLGTFFLVFAGTGAMIIHDQLGQTIGHVGISITFGLVVMAMIYAIGDISGAHINPAVTIAFWIAGLFPSRQVVPYILGQLAGAALASFFLMLVFPSHHTLGGTFPAIGTGGAFAFEMILTFLLMFVIIHVATGAKETGLMAGVAVGGTVCLAALFAGPVTGASMNPARSFGPALVSFQFQHLWLYISAPIIGAALAVFCCRFVRPETCCNGNGCDSRQNASE